MAQIGPQLVPSEDFLVDKVGAARSILLTAVGEAHNKPGDGGNAGGVEPDPSKLGVRWTTDLTSAFSFAGPEHNRLFGSQNPARGDEARASAIPVVRCSSTTTAPTSRSASRAPATPSAAPPRSWPARRRPRAGLPALRADGRLDGRHPGLRLHRSRQEACVSRQLKGTLRIGSLSSGRNTSARWEEDLRRAGRSE